MLDSNQLKNKLSTEDIIKLCCDLQGSDEYYFDNQGNPIFSTILDHQDSSGSFKLYYYTEAKSFHVYTRGISYDVFELVRRAKGLETFRQAFDFLVDYFHLNVKGFEEDANAEPLISDWDIFQKVKDYASTPKKEEAVIPVLSENLLSYFYGPVAPEEWIKEGIHPDVMEYYGIRIDPALHKIIIPHRDANGSLIGIRGRSFNPIELEQGKKYMPVFIEGEMYAHPLGKNLYGLYENKETIKKIKKVLIVEAEKSVMQLGSIYGIDHCWAVATCGSNLSKDQIKLLLELGIEEVVLAYDADQEGHKGEADCNAYEEKLYKVVEPLLPYVNVSIIFDYDHLLPQRKMSPTDCGKEIFEKLYHQRVKLTSYKETSLEKKRRKK